MNPIYHFGIACHPWLFTALYPCSLPSCVYFTGYDAEVRGAVNALLEDEASSNHPSACTNCGTPLSIDICFHCLQRWQCRQCCRFLPGNCFVEHCLCRVCNNKKNKHRPVFKMHWARNCHQNWYNQHTGVYWFSEPNFTKCWHNHKTHKHVRPTPRLYSCRCLNMLYKFIESYPATVSYKNIMHMVTSKIRMQCTIMDNCSVKFCIITSLDVRQVFQNG